MRYSAVLFALSAATLSLAAPTYDEAGPQQCARTFSKLDKCKALCCEGSCSFHATGYKCICDNNSPSNPVTPKFTGYAHTSTGGNYPTATPSAGTGNQYQMSINSERHTYITTQITTTKCLEGTGPGGQYTPSIPIPTGGYIPGTGVIVSIPTGTGGYLPSIPFGTGSGLGSSSTPCPEEATGTGQYRHITPTVPAGTGSSSTPCPEEATATPSVPAGTGSSSTPCPEEATASQPTHKPTYHIGTPENTY